MSTTKEVKETQPVTPAEPKSDLRIKQTPAKKLPVAGVSESASVGWIAVADKLPVASGLYPVFIPDVVPELPTDDPIPAQRFCARYTEPLSRHNGEVHGWSTAEKPHPIVSAVNFKAVDGVTAWMPWPKDPDPVVVKAAK